LVNWKKHFSQLFIAHGASEVRHSEIHRAKPPVTQPRAVDVEMFIENVKRHKFPGVDQIPAKFIKSGERKTCSVILKRPNSIWKKQECSEEWKGSIILPIYRKSDKTKEKKLKQSHYRP
jgi:hypothetical protein